MTVDEIVATLKHSDMPTLVVEGDDDVIVFRRLEEGTENLRLSVLQVGGRKALLQIFARIDEIGNKKLFFIADLDLWVLSGVPAEYLSNKLTFTEGYALENDAFHDTEYDKLLYPEERAIYETELSCFLRWYSLAVSRHLTDPSLGFKNNASEILNDEEHRAQLMQLRDNEVYPEELFARIAAEPERIVRGKSLMQVFARRMNARLQAKHNVHTMLEHAAIHPKQRVGKLFDAARAALQ
jgi:hypothetical protein